MTIKKTIIENLNNIENNIDFIDYFLNVNTNSSYESIICLNEDMNEWKVSTNITPEKNRANIRIIENFAKKFQISKKNIYILKGKKSKKKILRIYT